MMIALIILFFLSLLILPVWIIFWKNSVKKNVIEAKKKSKKFIIENICFSVIVLIIIFVWNLWTHDLDKIMQPIKNNIINLSEINAEVIEEKNSILKNNISSINPIDFSVKNLDYKIIGVGFGANDSSVKFELRDTGFFDGLLGATTFVNLKNTDSLLAVYYEVSPSTSVTSPRVIPKIYFNTYLIDDKKDKGVFIINTLEDKLASLDNPLYGILLFGVYSDSEYFDIYIDEARIRVKTEDLIYMPSE